MKTRYILRLLFIFVLLFALLNRSEALSAHYLNIENGLSSRQVFQIKKDSVGFVWLFTHLGVDRYDGREFRHYKLDETLDAKDHIIALTVMACDREGQLWISLKNGKVFAYDSVKDKFVCRIQLSDYLAEGTTINQIYFDLDNRLWLSLSSGLFYYDEEADQLIENVRFHNEYVMRLIQVENGLYFAGTTTHLYSFSRNEGRFSPLDQLVMPEEMRVESFFEEGGKLYIGTFSNGMYLYDLNNKKLSSANLFIPDVPIRTIVPVGDEVWIATDGSGVYCIDKQTDRFLRRYYAEEDDENSLSGNTVSDIMVDEQQCVWISTYTNGITIFRPHFPKIKKVKHRPADRQSLLSNHVNVILEDSAGDVWYGTNNGVSLYQPDLNRWTHFMEDGGGFGDRSSVVLALCEDRRQRIWVGGYGIGVYCIDKKGKTVKRIDQKGGNSNGLAFPTDYIYKIYAEEDRIWFGGIEGDFVCYNTETDELLRYPIDCIGDIRQGNGNNLLLAGCEGLAFFNKSNGTVLWHREFDGVKLSYPVRCLLQASDGKIWLGTDGEGLIKYDPEIGSARFFTDKNGLNSNSVNGVVEDEYGQIWFTTETCLYRFDEKENRVQSMNEFADVEWGAYNPNACIRKKNGDLAFGTANGVMEFSPGFEPVPDESVHLLFSDFKLLYESVSVDEANSPLNQAIDHTSVLHLTYKQNSFSLAFSSINFLYPQQINYMYKLNGFDKDWRSANRTNQAEYMNLQPGKYNFQLQAVHKYTQQLLGEREVRIIIGQPFWYTAWGWIIYILIGCIFIYLLYQFVRNRLNEHDAKEKIRFFIHIAHDIRIPVTLIKAPLSELEMDENLSDKAKKSVSVALKNVDKLFSLVTQLLDLQKMDHNAEFLDIQPHDIYTYLQEKVMAFRMTATKKKIDVLLEIDPAFPIVRFDKNKMDIILDNLLSNAVKYTENGYISISVVNRENEWSLSVQDTGVGVPAHEQKQIFKQFYRASNAINMNETGSGIGLLLTKKLVTLHNGKITFSSIEGEGSIFTLTFPSAVKESAKPDKKVEDKRLAEKEASAKKDVLLLAEDDKDLLEYLKESLSADYRVIAVSEGDKALQLAKEINPDLIISDILMPGLRGDEMCRVLKSSIETSHIPFILLSGLNEKENVIMGLEAGADDYIIKPFDFNLLKARIRNIIQSRQHIREIFLSDEKPLEQADYVNELDKEFLDKAILIIEKELNNPDFSINEFCRELAMSRTSVYNKIKTLTGQGPNDFIRIIRLNKAKELLKTKKYAISEVATIVGFSDAKYFSTIFKKQFGVSPSKIY